MKNLQITCLMCDSTKQVEAWHGEPWCKSCKEKAEKRVETEKQRINPAILREDTTIQVSSDIFNAKTQAIVELKKAIDDDPTIQNKQFELARILSERFDTLKQAIFARNQKNLEDSSEQRSIQTYLNNLANSLRQDEREKLKLKDLTYQPKPPKKPSKAKTKKTVTQKFNKTELKQAAADIGMEQFVLRTLCIQKNVSPTELVKELKAQLGKE